MPLLSTLYDNFDAGLGKWPSSYVDAGIGFTWGGGMARITCSQGQAAVPPTPGGNAPAFVQGVSGTSLTNNPTQAITTTAGNTLVAVIDTDGGSAAVLASITDTQGNTWTKVLSNFFGSGTGTLEVWMTTGTGALTASNTGVAGGAMTININWTDAASSRVAWAICEYTGVLTTATPVDQQTAVATGTSTAVQSALTSTTTQADEIIIHAFAHTGAATTYGGGVASNITTGGSNTTAVAWAGQGSQIVAATGTYRTNITLGASRTWGAAAVTLKAAPAGPGSPGSPAVSAYNAIQTGDIYALQNFPVYWQWQPPAQNGATSECFIEWKYEDNTASGTAVVVSLDTVSNAIRCFAQVAFAPVGTVLSETYDPALPISTNPHHWVMCDPTTPGKLTFRKSSDGRVWTDIGTIDTPSWALTKTTGHCLIQCHRNNGTDNYGFVKHFNSAVNAIKDQWWLSKNEKKAEFSTELIQNLFFEEFSGQQVIPALAARAAVQSSLSTPFTWLAIGDSITEGQGATLRSARWIERVRDMIRYRMGHVSTAVGYFPAFYYVYGPDSPWANDHQTASGGAFEVVGGFGYRWYYLNPGSTIQFTVQGTSADLWYAKTVSPSGGTITVAVDGVNQHVAVNTQAATRSLDNRLALNLGTNGTHTVLVTSNTGYTPIMGITTYGGDSPGGVELYDGAHTMIDSGQYVANREWTAGQTPLYSEMLPAIRSINPDLVTIGLGTNDFLNNVQTSRQLNNNLKKLVFDVLNMPSKPSVLLIGMYKPAPGVGAANAETWDDYMTQVRQLASTDPRIGFLDLTREWLQADKLGTWIYKPDGIHPNDAGHAVLAPKIANYILGDATQADSVALLDNIGIIFNGVDRTKLGYLLQDDFTGGAINTSKWKVVVDSPSVYTQTGGQYVMQHQGGNQPGINEYFKNYISSKTASGTVQYDIRNSYAKLRWNTGGNGMIAMHVSSYTGGNESKIYIREKMSPNQVEVGTWNVDTTVSTPIASTSITRGQYNWMRLSFSEDGQTCTASVSTNGTSWTDFSTFNVATYLPTASQWNPQRAYVEIAPSGTTGSDYVYLDEFNTTPVGGTDYVKTADDALGLTDSATAVLNRAAAPADSAGLTDGRVVDLGKAVADSAGLSDTATPAADRPRTQADALGLTDTASPATDFVRTAGDALGLTDSATGLLSVVTNKQQDDSAGLTDSTTVVQDQVELPADVSNLSDIVSAATAFARTPADSAGLTDTAAAVVDAVRAISDSAGLTDTATAATDFPRSQSDSAALSDAVTVVKTVDRIQSDSVGLSDAALPAISEEQAPADVAGITDTATPASDFPRSASDALGLSDSVSAQPGKTAADSVGLTDTVIADRGAAVAEPVGISDSVTAVQDQAETPADSASLTDTATPAAGLFRTVPDPLGLTDSVSGVLSVDRTIADGIGLEDSSFGAASGGVTPSDPSFLDDEAVSALGYNRTVSDSAGLTDSAALDRAKTQADSAGLTDSTTVAADRPRTLSEAIGLADSASAVLGNEKTTADNAGLTDSVTVELTVNRTLSDSLLAGDVIGTQFAGQGERFDNLGITDDVQVTLFSGDAEVDDSAALTDSVTVELTRIIEKEIDDFLESLDTAVAFQPDRVPDYEAGDVVIGPAGLATVWDVQILPGSNGDVILLNVVEE